MNRRFPRLFGTSLPAACAAACALALALPATAQQQQDIQPRPDSQERRSTIERSGAEKAGKTRDYSQGSAREDWADQRRTQARQGAQDSPRQQQSRQQQARTGRQDLARMEYQQVRGKVQDVRRATLRGADAQTYLVLVETDRGNRFVIDAGEGVQGLRLTQDQMLEARGRPVEVAPGRIILMASNIRADGRVYDVNRPSHRGGQDRSASR